jgi:hypothetical protein
MMIEDAPTILWTLHRDGREAACRARLAPYGIEIDLTSDGEAIVTRVFESGEEALAWADKKRVDRESQGWRAADAG